MHRTIAFAPLLVLSLLTLAAAAEELQIAPCLLTIQDEAAVPAQEAGVLVALEVLEGDAVKRDQLLGQIDDSARQHEQQVTRLEQQAAHEEATNDVNVRFARASERVAAAEYQQADRANKRLAETFPAGEIRRLYLGWQRAALQIEQAAHAQKLAGYTDRIKAAHLSAADDNIRRRQLRAPLDGEVVELLKRRGEWVAPGDTVARVVRFDVLRVEGFVRADAFEPAELADQAVTVSVELARGRREVLPGRIVHVSNQVEPGGEYRVWAEISNRRERGRWLLRPGLPATMTCEAIVK